MDSTLYEFFYGHASINERLFLLVNHATTPLLDAVMPILTFLGDSRLVFCYLPLLFLVTLLDRKRMPGCYPAVYLLAVLISLGAEDLIKELFRIPRPPVVIGSDQVRVLGHLSRSFSLPSGHAVFAFTTATVVGHGRSVRWKAPLYLLAGLVAWSRVYLGVHYPLDVLAGAFVGSGCALLVWKGYGWGEMFMGRGQGGATPGG